MKLPTNQHISECFSTSEIAQKIEGGDYSAELLLQHLSLHWNRVEEWGALTNAGLRLRCGELTSQEIRIVRAVLKALLGHNTTQPTTP